MRYKLSTGCFLLTVFGFATGCSNPMFNPLVPGMPDQQTAPDFYVPTLEPEYHIRVGDRLSVRSYFDNQLNQEVVVRRDGRISLLLLNDVMAFDKTPNELSTSLSEQYAQHIPTADVTVAVVESKGLSVYVGGEVQRSSEQPLEGPLTVTQAVTAAGGFLPSANRSQVLVLRRQDDGRFVAYQIDIDKVLVNQAKDVYLNRYDIVHVPMSRIAHVGRFVDQYINQIIPEAFRFNANYMWVDEIGDSNARLEVISP